MVVHTITEIKLYCTIKGLLGDQLYKDFCKSDYILVIDSAWLDHPHPQQSKVITCRGKKFFLDKSILKTPDFKILHTPTTVPDHQSSRHTSTVIVYNTGNHCRMQKYKTTSENTS